MNRNLKLYPVGSNAMIINWMRGSYCHDLEKADVVVFPGGADINPALYGEEKHDSTSFDEVLDARDILAFDRALAMKKKMVGICRGAQFLCAKAGGKLVQHQQDKSHNHIMMTYDGMKITVTSAHHQAMFPWTMPSFQVLGWTIGESLYHDGSKIGVEMVKGKAPLDMEVEMAYFEPIDALCIQSHPEWQYPNVSNNAKDRDAIEYFRSIMDRFMDGDKFTESSNAYKITA